MNASDREQWRPMRFGRRRAADVEDPLIEPEWEGIRVLVHFSAGAASIVDDLGVDLTARFADVPEALAGSIRAESAVLDGYLTTQATESGEGTSIKVVETPTAAQIVGQFLMGKSGERALGGSDKPKRPPGASTVVAFVAVDLLEVDGSDLLDVPLLERRRVLESVVSESDLVRLGIFVRPPASTFLVSWPSLGFSRMTYKAQNGRYRPGAEADDWAVTDIPRRR